MRQHVLRVVCDGCGLVVQIETHNFEPLTATLYPQQMLDRQGWRTLPKEGSSFATHDTCPNCLRESGTYP